MSNRDKILTKIQRLLRLAESANVHEATNAASQAQAMMAKYKIASAEVESGGGEAEPEVGEHDVSPKGQKWTWSLMWALARPLGVKPWIRGRAGGKACYVVIGDAESAATVRYLYAYLERAIEQDLRKRKRAGTIYGRRECHAFRMGAINEIGKRMRAANRTAAREHAAALQSSGASAGAEERALARVESSSAAEAYMARHGMCYGKGRRSTVTSASGYSQGRAFGRSVALGGGRAIGAGQGRLSE